MKKPLKRVFCPSLNRMFAFGRKHPVVIGPHLRLSNYLRGSLPTPPASCDWTAAALKAIAQMYGNDVLGDCVIAAGYHIEGVETGNAGDMFIATEAQIEKDYGSIGGYVPGDPSTDQGCDEVTAMNWWAANGFADKVKPLGWISVDPTNKTEVMQALYLFENCMFGVDLPDAWVNPMPSASGFIWDAAGSPDPENGHGFNGAGYDSAVSRSARGACSARSPGQPSRNTRPNRPTASSWSSSRLPSLPRAWPRPRTGSIGPA